MKTLFSYIYMALGLTGLNVVIGALDINAGYKIAIILGIICYVLSMGLMIQVDHDSNKHGK